jgi:hypothetical protein
MRRYTWPGFATGALLLWTACAQAAEIKWVSSFDSALRQAKASNKLIMADFYTDW